MNKTAFLLNLKALVWSVYVSYADDTVAHICEALRSGTVDDSLPEMHDTHLGKGLHAILKALPHNEDRHLIAEALPAVRQSLPSTVYRNRVIEVGHYVTPQAVAGVPDECHGVVLCIESSRIVVLFLLPDRTLCQRFVHPHEVCPVYTLTISD